MYLIDQYSLREYELTNNSVTSDIYYTIEKYQNKRYNPSDLSGVWTRIERVNKLESSDKKRIFLPNDGVFRLILSSDEDLNSIIDTYIIHNITNLLEKRQEFLTKLLTEYRVDPKHHNQYYDFISFSVLFETYNKIVKDTFTKQVEPSNLYMIEYLLTELQKYYYNG